MSKEIDGIIKGSELTEMADFLTDKDNKVESAILCYQTKSDVGYRLLGESGIATILGLLVMCQDEMRSLVGEMLNEEREEQ